MSGQLYRVFERELGAGTDGEMRGVRGIPHQYDVALSVEVAPSAAGQAGEIEPGRAAQMPRIADQAGSVEHFAEQIFAEFDRPLFVGGVEAVCLEDIFGGFDDEGRGVIVEFVDMSLKPSVVGAAEIEGEGVVRAFCAKPDEAVGPHHHVRLEGVLVALANLPN